MSLCRASVDGLTHAPVLTQINLPAQRLELLGLLRHPGFGLSPVRRPGTAERVPDLLRNLHGAEFRAAHGAEMGDLVGLFGQGLVVEVAGGFRVEGEVELVFPAEFEPGA